MVTQSMPVLWVRCLYQHVSLVRIQAVVDSGSPYCLFKTDIANFLKIDLTKAPQGSLGGIIDGLSDPVYFHKIKLQVENNWTFEVLGGFMKKLSWPIILGRNGFFDRFQVAFDHSVTPHEFEIKKIDLIN
jgi:hypothetical protein